MKQPLSQYTSDQETKIEYGHSYHAYSTQEVAERLECHLDIHRQLYNYVRWDYENSPEDDKSVRCSSAATA